jgi:hypothetical protein
VATLALYAAYWKGSPEAVKRSEKSWREQGSKLKAGFRRNFAAEASWFVIFQTNFLFFAVFALFSYVLLPQFESKEVPLGLKFGLVHAALSILPPAALVFFKGRTSLY